MTRSRALALLALVLPAALASAGARLRPLSSIDADDKGVGLQTPQGVAFDGKSLLVVADTGNRRLVRYTLEGDRVVPAGAFRLNEVPYPIKVQIGPAGDLFVLDGKLRRIARIASSGEFKGYVPIAGEGTTGAAIPRSFAIDRGGDLFVLDVHAARVIVQGADGTTRRQIGFPKDTGFLSDVAVDDTGTVYAVDSVARRVCAARPADPRLLPWGPPLKEFAAFPTALAVDARHRVFVADQNEGGIVILGPDGSFLGRQAGMGWNEGELRSPTGLCAGIAATIFVADRDNDRVQRFEVTE